VEKENGTIVEIYSDYAISGSSIRNRPGMRALLEGAKSGKFDCVIAEALDRLSRDQEDTAAIYKRLQHSDIRLLTLAEGEISELHVGLKGTMNALFLKDLALKIRRGQRGRVEAGRIPGGSSYGYRIIRRLLADGSVSTGEREIDPSQAAIIRRVFKEYADGMAPRQIAARLNREAVPSPRGGHGMHQRSTAIGGDGSEFSTTSSTVDGSSTIGNGSSKTLKRENASLVPIPSTSG
jgi:DNA invertase Pin-like site-specific DNA recombinase